MSHLHSQAEPGKTLGRVFRAAMRPHGEGLAPHGLPCITGNGEHASQAVLHGMFCAVHTSSRRAQTPFRGWVHLLCSLADVQAAAAVVYISWMIKTFHA